MKYKKVKIAVSIDERLVKKIDKIKKYPKWNENRSALVEYLLYEALKGEKE